MALLRRAMSLLLVACGLLVHSAASAECSGDDCSSDAGSLLQLSSRSKGDPPSGGLRWWGKMMGGCRSKFKNVVGADPLTLNGPTLNASSIPKYVTPLVIPPVMRRAGACHKGRCGDYEIAVRQFKQQILPGGVWNSPAFADFHGGQTFDFPATTVWSFGPADDPQPDSQSLGGDLGVAPASNSQFNYPAYTIETITNKPVKVDWINHLVKDPWRCNHRKPPDCCGAGRILNYWQCKACEFTKHITPVDQSLHWANPGKLPCKEGRKTDCMPLDTSELRSPYAGPVPLSIHLHGAHVQPESDGYPEAWYLPAASNIPRGFAQEGSMVNKYGKGRKTNHKKGVASFTYQNDQPTTTLWFHDHTLGMTRNNVYAGPAGFWLIRKADGGEDGLVKGTLPHPAPAAGQTLEETNLAPGRNRFREIPIVIQDRSFNLDGSLFYPADRAFFEGLRPDQLKIPFLGDSAKSTDVPPIWNPEVFFDTIVVNGVTWPLMEVEPDIYRFRLLNGCNGRTLNLLMFTVDHEGQRQEEVPFYVIGGDQSLLPKVVLVKEGSATALPGDGTIPDELIPSQQGEGLLMGPAYRSDVLVDFSALEEGTLVQIFNTGEDKSPFAGFPIGTAANPDTVGQVMRFRVVKDTALGEDATPPQDLVLSLVDAHDPAADLTPTPGRQLSLMEFPSKTVCAFPPEANGDVLWDPKAVPSPPNENCKDKVTGQPAESQPFAPLAALLGKINGVTANGVDATGLHWSSPISQNPSYDATETWEFWDLTVDAHPIHLHLVRFRVLGRRAFEAATGALGPWKDLNPTDAGWRDTILVYPGEVTYVKARFDIKGLYVWHCHMLEHEDQEMMLPYCVGDLETSPGCAQAQKMLS